MIESGSATFTIPDDYQTGIGGANVRLVVTGRGDFRARLTWLKLRHLHVFRGRENGPRIAYVSLLPGRAFASFPMRSDAPPIWCGRELGPDEIVFHSTGERSHQWTKGASQWGLVSLPPKQLAYLGKTLNFREITPPLVGRVLRPLPAALANLRRLLSNACRVAETKPEIIAQPEAARALEHDVTHALIDCLTADEAPRATNRHHAEIMLRFEDALTLHTDRQLSTAELCAAVGVSARTLRACCAQFLGLGPNRYIQLRRLNMARTALQRADPATANVAKIAQSFQFSEIGHFAAAYHATFGELPSVTLRRSVIRLR